MTKKTHKKKETKFSFYLGAAASAWLLTILVVAAELSQPFKSLLIGAFSHHWVGKIVIITLAFIVSGFLLKKRNYFGKSDEKIGWYSVIGSLLVIFLFYVIEFFV